MFLEFDVIQTCVSRVEERRPENNKSRARRLRKHMTDAERKLWHLLRSRQLVGFKFRRQQPIGRFIVDFVCLERRLVIELDGGQHTEKNRAAYDSERTVWLEHNGFRVLRFWDHEVLQHLDAVQEAITNALNPTSSPSTGED